MEVCMSNFNFHLCDLECVGLSDWDSVLKSLFTSSLFILHTFWFSAFCNAFCTASLLFCTSRWLSILRTCAACCINCIVLVIIQDWSHADVSSVPTAKRKGFFDLHGEEALKHGKPDGNGGTKGAFYNFDSSDCTRIFTSFFGTNNPYEALEDLTTTFQSMTATNEPKQGKMQTHPVELTLEEVYHGCLKKVTYQRRRITVDDRMEVENRVLTIDIKPGLPEDTRFVFEGCVSNDPQPMHARSSRVCIKL